MNWKYFGRAHKLLYKLSGGRVGARMGWIDVALFEVVGRRSGKVRTVPVACYPYRDSIVISASNSGMEVHPAWYVNMCANPDVIVQKGQERYAATAEEVPVADREALWKEIIRINKHQGEYLSLTKREIPLVWFRRKG